MVNYRLPNSIRLLALSVIATAGVGAAHAMAAPIAVTFDPSVAVAGQSQFTATQLNLNDYSRVDLGATTGSNTAFSERGYLQVGDVFNGSSTHIVPPGLNSTYSLYLSYTAAGTQSAPNFTGSSSGTIDSLTYTLYEASGNSMFSITADQPMVTNAGTPVAVASGSLIAGTTSFSSNPLGAGANVDATFAQLLAGFIVSPANAMLTLHGAFNNDSQLIHVLSSGTSFTLNGGGGDLTFTSTPMPAPEPMSLAVLGVGLAGLGMVRRRR